MYVFAIAIAVYIKCALLSSQIHLVLSLSVSNNAEKATEAETSSLFPDWRDFGAAT